MKDKSKKSKTNPEKRWEKAALLFEDPIESLKIMKKSKVLSAIEQRKLLGPSKTKPISIRLPEEDLEAIKEVAENNERPYQQIIVTAVEQYLDRLAAQLAGRKPSIDFRNKT